MPIWITLLLILLTTHRVTRLVTRDQFPLIALPREAFARRWSRISVRLPDTPEDAWRARRNDTWSGARTNVVMHSLAYLWECDWCASMWVGALVVVGAWHWAGLSGYPVYISVLTWLAASTATGLIAQREPD